MTLFSGLFVLKIYTIRSNVYCKNVHGCKFSASCLQDNNKRSHIHVHGYEQYFSGVELMAMTSLTILERETNIHKSKKVASFFVLGQHSTTILYYNIFMQHIQELFNIYICLKVQTIFIHENETNPKTSPSKQLVSLVRLRKRLKYIVQEDFALQTT